MAVALVARESSARVHAEPRSSSPAILIIEDEPALSESID
jgi:hypothetical protein